MASLPRRVYWDACTWIALIQREKIQSSEVTEDREMLCRSVLEAAKKGDIEIVTSTLSYAEVCKDPGVRSKDQSLITTFFENDYVLPINLDREVGERAHTLMRSGYTSLKPADAIHAASAAIANVEAMHTFDRVLLVLDGLIDKKDGTKLKICKPDAGTAPAPLLERMNAPDESPHAQS